MWDGQLVRVFPLLCRPDSAGYRIPVRDAGYAGYIAGSIAIRAVRDRRLLVAFAVVGGFKPNGIRIQLRTFLRARVEISGGPGQFFEFDHTNHEEAGAAARWIRTHSREGQPGRDDCLAWLEQPIRT